jgi:DNA-binding CsgD family transcriptional regulator
MPRPPLQDRAAAMSPFAQPRPPEPHTATWNGERLAPLQTAIRQCTSGATIERLDDFVATQLTRLIPHQLSLLQIIVLESERLLWSLAPRCPAPLRDDIEAIFAVENNRLFRSWLSARTPQHCSVKDLPNRQLNPDQRRTRDVLVANGIRDVVAHGTLDVMNGLASIIYLGGFAGPLSEEQTLALEVLAPHLHQCLLAISRAEADCLPEDVGYAALALTRREKEILKWLSDGKTNYSIGTILGISELTVRNHVRNIMLKLGAENRTHAVIKALQGRLI